jgi:hypothetical protein
MKMVTSIVFEIDMPSDEAEAYKALSDKERENRIEEMKKDMAKMISNETVGKTNFTKFTIEFKEGE